jgi:Flp pilus assembly protein TadD
MNLLAAELNRKWSRVGAVFALLIFVLQRGCVASPLAAQEPAAGEASRQLTWVHDIAPILYKNCTSCHHPGGAGPFSLLTYADAKRWAPQVVKVTQSRYMPPWLPEPGHGDFADVRRMDDVDIARLRRWFLDGMREGKTAEAPTAPAYEATWQLGKPDLILKASKPFTLDAGGTDVFRNFVLPYPLKETHFIRAMEIRPGAPQVVHHANVLIDRTASFRRQHPDDWQAGVPGMEILLDAGNTFDPDSHFLFWKPDTPALVEPDGMPWRLDPGNDLVLNIHLKPSGKQETIDAEIGLYFTDKPPSKQPMLLQLDRDDALDIPAGDKNFIVEDSLTLPIDVEALGVYPHAHYIGKEMQAWATLPNGDKRWLVWIRDWDIDRQSVYRYREPLLLPKGTVLHMRYVYDNSAANPRNPHNPPVRVKAGNRSEDEMAHLWLQVLPAHADANGPDPRLQLEEAWMRSRLRKSPDDRISLYNLGAALAGQDRYKEAVSVYQQEHDRHPEDMRVLTALGAARDGAGDWQAARADFVQAAKTAGDGPEQCNARFDLATLDLRHEQLDAADEEFRALLAECSADAESLSGLAEVELAKGETAGAIQHFTEAIRIAPNVESTHADLARAYAESGDLEHAQTELRKAVALKPDDAQLHAALSQVLAGSGHFSEALSEQQLALQLNSKDADGWNNLGVLNLRTGNAAEARRDFGRALEIQPDHAQAKANLARLSGPQ